MFFFQWKIWCTILYWLLNLFIYICILGIIIINIIIFFFDDFFLCLGKMYDNYWYYLFSVFALFFLIFPISLYFSIVKFIYFFFLIKNVFFRGIKNYNFYYILNFFLGLISSSPYKFLLCYKKLFLLTSIFWSSLNLNLSAFYSYILWIIYIHLFVIPFYLISSFLFFW